MYPIFEEVIFRGMIIPILNNAFSIFSNFEIAYIPVTLPILISSFLFAVSHLQYYKFNQTSIKFMLFAFLGNNTWYDYGFHTINCFPNIITYRI